MDIMNIMKVSSSKFTFSLIAFAALLVSGSGLVIQDSFAAIDAPEFTAIHLNTTATLVTFDQSVNGTLALLDWTIMFSSTGTDGDILTDVAITGIANATNKGVGQTVPGDVDKKTGVSSGTGVVGLGYINGTDIVLIHSAIPSDSTYFVNYTNNAASLADAIGQFGQIHANERSTSALSGNGAGGVGACVAESAVCKYLKIGSNATAVDYMSPTFVSADILKSNAKKVQITLSETANNHNTTAADFTLTKTFTTQGIVYTNTVTPVSVTSGNNTSHFDINLKHPLKEGDILTVTYDSAAGTAIGISHWITDGVSTGNYTSLDSDGKYKLYPTSQAGHGNRLLNFTATVTNWLEIGQYGDVTTCYDCTAPTVSAVQVSLDSSIPVTVNDDNAVQINAGIGDTVSVMVTVDDNMGAGSMPFAGLYTNFGDTPDNLFYANNFDGLQDHSTSYYEWNSRADDTAFGNTDAITWDEATSAVNLDGTMTITYAMTINDSIESSQVWVDLGDKTGNYAKLALPITLEVAGPPAITFASDDSQQVVSYFNESILLAIVSQWTATSSDDATNVEQLSSVLGIEDQLPTWTTSLASWVSDDKIDVADMIVAVEYVINQ
mgnify:CR=1 FL=1